MPKYTAKLKLFAESRFECVQHSCRYNCSSVNKLLSFTVLLKAVNRHF